MSHGKCSQQDAVEWQEMMPGLITQEIRPWNTNPLDFESLVHEHKDAVYRQLIRVCGNREDAEDALIEALLKAHNNLDQLRNSKAFRAWLKQIATRVCWQIRNREALLPILQLSTLEEQGLALRSEEPSPEEELARQEMKRLLVQAIHALPVAYRRVYELRDLDECSGDETVKKLRIKKEAMKSRLHRARQMVRQNLDAALQAETKPGKGSTQ